MLQADHACDHDGPVPKVSATTRRSSLAMGTPGPAPTGPLPNHPDARLGHRRSGRIPLRCPPTRRAAIGIRLSPAPARKQEADARICRIEGVARAHVYALIGMITRNPDSRPEAATIGSTASSFASGARRSPNTWVISDAYGCIRPGGGRCSDEQLPLCCPHRVGGW